MSPLRGACLLALLASSGLAASNAASETRERSAVLVGSHARVVLSRDVQRVAVGDPAVLDVEVVTSSELLVLGKRVGRTTVLLWFEGGAVEERVWSVERDLSTLAAALREIHPAIRVEAAPDQDAVVLRGVVPDARFVRAAEAAARSYLGGGRDATPLVRGSDASGFADSVEDGPDAAEGDVADGEPFVDPNLRSRVATIGAGSARSGVNVINLIRVDMPPAAMEERLRSAVAGLGGERIAVRRIVRGDVASDAFDTFLLEGSVPDQIALVRILIAASQVLGASDAGVRVLANEAGGLGALGRPGGGGQATSGGTRIGTASAIGFQPGGGRGSGGSGAGGELSANIGRATALAAAGGRILAFLDVEDLPQVRIEARIFEVNRSRLRSWRPEIDVLTSDFDQVPLLPSRAGQRIQGTDAPRAGSFGSFDIQGALSLIGGAALGQWQLVASNFAIDALFSILEDASIARSLAQPSLSVLSGESADFQAGGQIPINVSIETDTTAAAGSALFNSVVFADFGVNLSVRPLVGLDDFVTLDVVPDISRPDLGLTAALRESTGTDQATTSFETRSLRTKARLRDGQALLIGGLLSRSQSARSTETPGLARIPGLGWLARDFDRQGDDLELVIVVTPAIVRDPVPAAALWAYPGAEELLGRPGNSARLAGTNN